MKLTIAVPWRPGDPWRERSCAYVLEHLRSLGERVVTTDSGHAAFNRAASRNAGVRAAEGTDVVILHDADMLAPAAAYREMAAVARSTGRMVVGFRTYRALSAPTTRSVLDGRESPWTAPAAAEHDSFSLGGIVAITPAAWWAVGGMDERFTGWGCEDTAFATAASVTLGPILRTENIAVHLWHPHAGETAGPTNGELLARYNAATSPEDVHAIRQS